MLAYPAVRRCPAFAPDVQRHFGEDEFVSLTARAAAQSVLVPLDPDVPSFISREGCLEVVPFGISPSRAAARPELQVCKHVRATVLNSHDIGTDFLPGGRAVGGGGEGGGGGGSGAGDGGGVSG